MGGDRDGGGYCRGCQESIPWGTKMGIDVTGLPPTSSSCLLPQDAGVGRPGKLRGL